MKLILCRCRKVTAHVLTAHVLFILDIICGLHILSLGEGRATKLLEAAYLDIFSPRFI